MNIKKITILLLGLCLLLSTFALASQPLLMETPLITSVNQYYSIVFDGEGEAIISLRLTVKNMDATPITEVNLEIPGNNVKVLGVLQESTNQQTQNCISWKTDCVEYGAGQTCVQYDYNGNCANYEQPCLKTGQVCTSYRTTTYTQPTYQKMDVTPVPLSTSVSLPIKFVSSLSKDAQTNILVIYKVQDYASNVLGAYHFDFETAKTAYYTNTVRVAINVQDNLYLKGTSSKVNYLTNFNTFGATLESSSKMSDEQTKQVSNYAQSITYASGLVKTSSYLDPLESLTVKGVYAGNWFRLYWTNIFWITLIIIVVIAFIGYGIKKLTKYASQQIPQKQAKQQVQTKHNFVVPFLTGLFTTMAITLLWIIAVGIIFLSESVFRYGAGQFFGILIVLFALLMSLALLIGVPIYIGNKFGSTMAFFTTLAMFGWLFIFAIITFFVVGVISIF